uniref:Uncharacterized protein n=1 Tax=Arundo donax TaxID=35708 RepID=A0A0A8YP56_ARUDO
MKKHKPMIRCLTSHYRHSVLSLVFIHIIRIYIIHYKLDLLR